MAHSESPVLVRNEPGFFIYTAIPFTTIPLHLWLLKTQTMQKIFLFLFLLPLVALAQKKQITLEDIYKNRTFQGEFIAADFGQTNKDPEIDPKELKDENGKPFDRFEDIIYSSIYPNTVLIRRGIEPIYRRSSKAIVYLYDVVSKNLMKLDNEKLMHSTLSPDGSKIAYVKNNNLQLILAFQR